MNAHRFIEQQDSEGKEALRSKTEAKLGFSLSQPSTSHPTKPVGRIFAFIVPAVCAVCLLIALPFLFKKDPAAPELRYCQAGDYTLVQSDCTLQEYNARHGSRLLYLDLYQNAAEVETNLYVSAIDATDVIYYREKFYLQDTYNEIILYITDSQTVVDILEPIEKHCIRSTTVEDVAVSFICNEIMRAATFEYQGYKYYIELGYAVEESEILQLVADMIR